MKRILIALLLLCICVPAYAAAPDEGGDSAGFIRDLDTIFNDVWEDNTNSQEFL